MKIINPHVIIDECNVQEYLNYYQKALSLEQWEIVVKFVKELDGSDANVIFKRDRQLAIISLIDHKYWDNQDFAQDMELSLVHELIHLVMCDITKDEYDIMEERAIEHIAKGIIRVRRCPIEV